MFISFCTSEIDSTPPATKISPSPARTRWAASAMVCRPEEQKRFTVIPGTLMGQAGADRDLAGDVPAGRAFGLGAADDHVLDFARLDLRALERGVHHVAAHLRAVGQVERAAPALAERRARGGNDDGVCHVGLLGFKRVFFRKAFTSSSACFLTRASAAIVTPVFMQSRCMTSCALRGVSSGSPVLA